MKFLRRLVLAGLFLGFAHWTAGQGADKKKDEDKGG